MIKTPILILGGMGMLGQDLWSTFNDFGPIVWDRKYLDITTQEAVDKQITKLNPGVVINAAAYNMVDDIETESGMMNAMAVNGDGPKYIAEVCKKIGATLIHYSSDYVFDGEKKAGYKEDDEPKPKSNYGISKLAGEKNVLATYPEAYIIRTCKLFGMPGTSKGSKKSFVDTMLRLAEDRDQLDVVDNELASPTYTADLAKQTKLLIEGDYEPGIYHVTNTDSCTWYEFAQEIFKIAGKDIKVKPVSSDAFPRPAPRPNYSILLNTKLPPLRSWQDALAEYIGKISQFKKA